MKNNNFHIPLKPFAALLLLFISLISNAQSSPYEAKLFGVWKHVEKKSSIMLIFHQNLTFTETNYSRRGIFRHYGNYKILFPFNDNARKILLNYSDGKKQALRFKYIKACPDMICIEGTCYTNTSGRIIPSYYTGKWVLRLKNLTLKYTLLADYKVLEEYIPKTGFSEKQHGSFSIEEYGGKYLIRLKFGTYTIKVLYFYQWGKYLQFRLALDLNGKKVFSKYKKRIRETYTGNLF